MSNVIGLSKRYETNLRKHAAFLRKLRTKKRFNMTVFDESMIDPYEQKCGTAACAVGWMPRAGFKPKKNEDWYEYSKRITGLDWRDKYSVWCFSSQWAYTDKTTKGAAERIEWLLDNGLPENWRSQLYGASQLLYKGYKSPKKMPNVEP